MSKAKDAAKAALNQVKDLLLTVTALIWAVFALLVAGLILSTVATAYGWRLPLLPAARPALDLLYLTGAVGVFAWMLGFKR